MGAADPQHPWTLGWGWSRLPLCRDAYSLHLAVSLHHTTILLTSGPMAPSLLSVLSSRSQTTHLVPSYPNSAPSRPGHSSCLSSLDPAIHPPLNHSSVPTTRKTSDPRRCCAPARELPQCRVATITADALITDIAQGSPCPFLSISSLNHCQAVLSWVTPRLPSHPS